MQKCSICTADMEPRHSALVLGRHDVQYYWCRSCGYLRTEAPYWLGEAYADAIARSDTGLVRRNVSLAGRLAPLLRWMWNRKATFVDVGGGYGMLVRLMRDAGFDFRWSDPMCTNLFARGYEAAADLHASALTAFEVLEHIPDPLGFIDDRFRRHTTRTLVFSTILYDGDPPSPGSWTYYSEQTGQHISFYTRRTLQELARRLGVRMYSHGSMHMLSDVAVPMPVFRACTSSVAAALMPLWFLSPGSKTLPDSAEALDGGSAPGVGSPK